MHIARSETVKDDVTEAFVKHKEDNTMRMPYVEYCSTNVQ